MNAKVNERLPKFIDALTKFVNDGYPTSYKLGRTNIEVAVPARVFDFEFGRKYARILHRGENESRPTVYCFVDMNTGDILKAASYRAPARNGVRGNIFADDFGISCCARHSLKYLR